MGLVEWTVEDPPPPEDPGTMGATQDLGENPLAVDPLAEDHLAKDPHLLVEDHQLTKLVLVLAGVASPPSCTGPPSLDSGWWPHSWVLQSLQLKSPPSLGALPCVL